MQNCLNNTLEIGTPNGFYYYSLPNVDYYVGISHADIKGISAEDWETKLNTLKEQISVMDKEEEEAEPTQD